MSLQRNALVFYQIEQRDFAVGAGQQHIVIELVDIDDVSILVWVVLGHQLEGFIGGSVFELEQDAVGVAAIDELVEGFDFVEGGQLAASE